MGRFLRHRVDRCGMSVLNLTLFCTVIITLPEWVIRHSCHWWFGQYIWYFKAGCSLIHFPFVCRWWPPLSSLIGRNSSNHPAHPTVNPGWLGILCGHYMALEQSAVIQSSCNINHHLSTRTKDVPRPFKLGHPLSRLSSFYRLLQYLFNHVKWPCDVFVTLPHWSVHFTSNPHDVMPYDPIQGQGHGASELPKIALFQVYLLRHLQWQPVNDHWFLN